MYLLAHPMSQALCHTPAIHLFKLGIVPIHQETTQTWVAMDVLNRLSEKLDSVRLTLNLA